eukprot:scaffold41682_cov104-Phaeocystis_antarctica.AAC.2
MAQRSRHGFVEHQQSFTDRSRWSEVEACARAPTVTLSSCRREPLWQDGPGSTTTSCAPTRARGSSTACAAAPTPPCSSPRRAHPFRWRAATWRRRPRRLSPGRTSSGSTKLLAAYSRSATRTRACCTGRSSCSSAASRIRTAGTRRCPPPSRPSTRPTTRTAPALLRGTARSSRHSVA